MMMNDGVDDKRPWWKFVSGGVDDEIEITVVRWRWWWMTVVMMMVN